MFKKLLPLFIAELLVIPAVGLIFSTISDRLRAGMVAGSLFILIGAWIFGLGMKNAQFRRTWTFYFGCIHLFVIALPMVIVRLWNATLAFEEVKIWGLPGPVFHKLSTWVFAGLLLATLVELIRAKLAERRAQIQ